MIGICDPRCLNGACVGNNTCFCSEGFTGDSCEIEGYSDIIYYYITYIYIFFFLMCVVIVVLS